jgi:hypothetical protein
MEAKEGEESGPQVDQRKLCSLKMGDHFMTGYLEGVTMTEDDTVFFSIHMQFLHTLHVCTNFTDKRQSLGRYSLLAD